jgi:predicted DNA repair protein MutK
VSPAGNSTSPSGLVLASTNAATNQPATGGNAERTVPVNWRLSSGSPMLLPIASTGAIGSRVLPHRVGTSSTS